MKGNYLFKKILLDLFKASDGLYIFTLYKRYNVSPSKLFLLVNELVERKIIINEENRIVLTSNGREYVISNNISLKPTTKKYERIPQNFIGRKIGINEFYLPKSTNIADELLS